MKSNKSKQIAKESNKQLFDINKKSFKLAMSKPAAKFSDIKLRKLRVSKNVLRISYKHLAQRYYLSGSIHVY